MPKVKTNLFQDIEEGKIELQNLIKFFVYNMYLRTSGPPLELICNVDIKGASLYMY